MMVQISQAVAREFGRKEVEDRFWPFSDGACRQRHEMAAVSDVEKTDVIDYA
jgi:hypothetical protein